MPGLSLAIRGTLADHPPLPVGGLSLGGRLGGKRSPRPESGYGHQECGNGRNQVHVAERSVRRWRPRTSFPSHPEALAAIRCSRRLGGITGEAESRLHAQEPDQQIHHMAFALAIPAIEGDRGELGLHAPAARFLEAIAGLPGQDLQMVLSAKPPGVPEITAFDQPNMYPIPQERRQ